MVKFNPENKPLRFPALFAGIEDIRTRNEANEFLKDFIDQLQELLDHTSPCNDLGARQWALLLTNYYASNSIKEERDRIADLFRLYSSDRRNFSTMDGIKAGMLTAQYLTPAK